MISSMDVIGSLYDGVVEKEGVYLQKVNATSGTWKVEVEQ
jgi:hypothetical protein